jgi:penicillin amidase
MTLLIKNEKTLSLIMKGVRMNISNRKQFLKMLIAMSLAALLIMTGCAENDQTDYELHTGVFKDSAVQGLKYKTATNDGMTDKNGRFYYCTGEMVTFFVGDIQLGEPAPAKPYMTPKDLVPQDKGNPEKNKLLIARFLQTLDNDDDLNNGIQITKEIHDNAVKTDSFDPESIQFIADENNSFSTCEQHLSSAIEIFNTSGAVSSKITLVNETSAQDHLNKAEQEQSLIEKDPAGDSNINDNIFVRRDDMGVWFINGPDDASLYDIFYEVGYQVATDRLWQLEQYRRAATGQLAALLGETYLENDIFVRTLGYTKDELQDGFDNLDEESQKVIQGYVEGINRRIDYVMDNRSQMPMEYVALGAKAGVDIVPTKWTETDLLAWNALLQRQFDPEALETDHGQLENIQLLGRLMDVYSEPVQLTPTPILEGQVMFGDLRWTDDPDAQTYILEEDVPDEWKTNKRKRMNTTVAIPQIPDYSAAISKLQQFRRRVKNNLERINANVKMGSYAWVVGPEKTHDGKPILYAGPQMGFDSPSINIECAIDAGGLNVSGMMIPGIPGIILGRTPHHAWSMQVGHVHSTDFYFDTDKNLPILDRQETIYIAGKEAPVTIPVFKIDNRPVISPLPFNPMSYTTSKDDPNPIVSWRYSHVGHEFNMVSAMLDLARAQNTDEFGKGIEKLGLSQHFCYADKEGNIAYWMSGRDPVRPADPLGLGYQLPQGAVEGVPKMPWDDNILKERSHLVNPTRYYFAGWNNKSHPYYSGSPNNVDYFTGPFHRSHVIYEYLDSHNDLTFEDVRELAISISTTESIGKAGNPWPFVKEVFSGAVALNPSSERQEALAILNAWDGHFVAGGKANWARGKDRSDGWMLMDKWVRKVIEKTFEPYQFALSKTDDSSGDSGAEGDDEADLLFGNEYQRRLLNVIIRSFKGRCKYDWFNGNVLAPPESAYYTTLVNAMKSKAMSIIVESLDEALADLGTRPWGVDKRGTININNGVVTNVKLSTITGICEAIIEEMDEGVNKTAMTSLLAGADNPVTLTLLISYLPEPYHSNLSHLLKANLYEIPFGSRSTYAQCIEYGIDGPTRIESFFPLGQSAHINWSMLLVGANDPLFKHFTAPQYTRFYHEHFFDMSIKYFDNFIHREFPLFK